MQRSGALSFFQGPYDAALLDWDTLSSIGPVSGEGFGERTYWQVPLVTDYVTLELMADGPAIFTAVVVSEPPTALMVGVGVVGLALHRRCPCIPVCDLNRPTHWMP